MKKTISVILLLSMPMVFSAGLADEHESATMPEDNTQNNQETAAPAEDTKNRATDAFVPTETISEDLSVPFPVDI